MHYSSLNECNLFHVVLTINVHSKEVPFQYPTILYSISSSCFLRTINKFVATTQMSCKKSKKIKEKRTVIVSPAFVCCRTSISDWRKGKIVQMTAGNKVN